MSLDALARACGLTLVSTQGLDERETLGRVVGTIDALNLATTMAGNGREITYRAYTAADGDVLIGPDFRINLFRNGTVHCVLHLPDEERIRALLETERLREWVTTRKLIVRTVSAYRRSRSRSSVLTLSEYDEDVLNEIIIRLLS